MNSEDLSRRMLPSQLEGDFSFVIGGPLFQALRRTHLTGDALELTRRRVVVVAMIVWVPLLGLLAVDGRAWGAPSAFRSSTTSTRMRAFSSHYRC